MIIRIAKKQPFFTIRQLQAEISSSIQLSESSITNVLIAAGLRARVSVKKPLLSPVNRNLRKQFCKDMSGKTMEYWKNVVFSDETTSKLLHRIVPKKQGFCPQTQEQRIRKKLYIPYCEVWREKSSVLGIYKI